jgi:hypothetical protein
MFMTTAQAAKRKNCKRITIIKAIGTGRLHAQKFGHVWMVLEDEKFQDFKVGKPGRPAKVNRPTEAS